VSIQPKFARAKRRLTNWLQPLLILLSVTSTNAVATFATLKLKFYLLTTRTVQNAAIMHQ